MSQRKSKRGRPRITARKREKKISLQGTRVQEFPRDAIRGLAKEYADTFSSYLESPWEFWAFSFLTCLGNILADRVTLESQISPQPRLFTILLGESARGRKSACIEQTVQFFSEALPQEFSLCRGVGSAEGLAQFLRTNPRTLLVFDEFKVFVSKSSAHASVLLPCVNTMFEANNYETYTKNSHIKVDRGYLSILAASTTDTFSRMWTSAFTDIGFINRLWLVPGESKRRIATPPSIPKEETEPLKENLISLIKSLPNTIKKLQITPKADRAFSKWYKTLPPSIYADRLDTYGHHLMILFCMNEKREKVKLDIALRVIRLLEWQLKVRRENQPIDAELRIARLEESIRRAVAESHPIPIKKRDLQRKVHYERYGLWYWNMTIRNLRAAGEIKYDSMHDTYSRAD